MLRYRRYRVFLLFTAIAIFLIYSFATPTRWEETTHAVDQVKQQLGLQQSSSGKKNNTQKQQQEPLRPPDIRPPTEKIPPPPVEPAPKPAQQLPPTKAEIKPQQQGRPPATVVTDGADERQRVIAGAPPGEVVEAVIAEAGEGRKEEDPLPTDAITIRWEPPEEHFALAETIQLPAGTPKPIPRIQHEFQKETSSERKDRLEKLDIIRQAFMHAWSGYKEIAWGKDELVPVTGSYKNPFNGWGATLIDSLDTLWIMGLKKEFEQAIGKVNMIDFRTSRRGDIPLFETTIRYLGGLLGAYDVSGGKYRVLLEKAVELAEILIGAFDTPNRMPITFYQWKPYAPRNMCAPRIFYSPDNSAFTSQPHRASNRLVLAELGSLAVEFTRLAQITKEPKYYDAIARITNALQEWQNHTRVPGLWPINIDASGCERVQYRTASSQSDGSSTVTNLRYEKPDPAADALNKLVEAAHSAANANPVGESSSRVSIPNPAANAGQPVDSASDGPASASQGKTGSGANKSPTYGTSNTATSGRTGASKGPGTTADNVEVHRITGWDENHPGSSTSNDEKEKDTKEEVKMEPLVKPPPVVFNVKPGTSTKAKRQLDKPTTDWENEDLPVVAPSPVQPAKQKVLYSQTPLPECVPHGLGSTSAYGTEEFTLGSMADSTYEYFPKEYIMLGGLVDQYREMYEWAMDVVKEQLLFRVMIPDEKREILIGGTYKASVPMNDDAPSTGTLTPVGTHLTCFAGGMFGLGAKVFNRPEDLEIAEKLTDGCVWAYETTTTGIMPETFHVVPCEDRNHCEWNETKWWDELDPNRDWREGLYRRQMQAYESAVAARASMEAALAAEAAAAVPTALPEDPSLPVAIQTAPPEPLDARSSKTEDVPKHENKKREAAAIDVSQPSANANPNANANVNVNVNPNDFPRTSSATTTVTGAPSRSLGSQQPIWSPAKPPTHEEFVRKRIEEDRIPPGISYIPDSRYILRPEALESVFYMYRITGNPYWREKGWNMISSVLRYTETEFGHSGIDDVTKVVPRPNDSMESFWLAETLKYAWLIFEEESKWGLDEWVFNTEAHLLRRPDAPREKA